MYALVEILPSHKMNTIDIYDSKNDAKIGLFEAMISTNSDKRTFLNKDCVVLEKLSEGYLYNSYQVIKTLEIKEIKKSSKQSYDDVIKELKMIKKK